MPHSKACLIVTSVLSLCALAGCQKASVAGSGYSFVRFADPKAAAIASQDATAGPAISSNNKQCAGDPACRK